MGLTRDDEQEVVARGAQLDDVAQQLERLRGGVVFVEPDRPCTPGDGIVQLSEADDAELFARCDAAALAGRVGHVVPASGAATRLFRSLLAARDAGLVDLDALERAVAAGQTELGAAGRVLRHVRELALWPHLLAADPGLADDAAAQDLQRVLAVMVDHLQLHQQPKGLIPFHGAGGGRTRTALAEHLEEARAMAPAGAPIRAHFTVGHTHQAAFHAAVEGHLDQWPAEDRARCRVGFSTQDPATDCVALDAAGQVARLADGRLRFRPGGHGALLRNLAEHGSPVTLIKNIDSVVSDRHRPPVVAWRRRLVGFALRLEEQMQGYLTQWEAHGASEEAMAFMAATFGASLEAPEELETYLRRPLRVCGMVAAAGHVGGGPYWVKGCEGFGAVHILEGFQLNADDPETQRRMQGATHFNPVDMVCVLGAHRGSPTALDAFAASDWWMLTEKTQGTQRLRVVERPGLWNGGMAKWNTVFVEIPSETFNPVKALDDLLGPRHRA